MKNKYEIANDINVKLLPITIDSAILLGILTALGYECTFLYEKSFCEYFLIPGDFVTIDINSVIPYWAQSFNIILIAFFASVGYVKIDSWLKNKRVMSKYISWNFLMLAACYITYIASIGFVGQRYLFIGAIIITNVIVSVVIIKDRFFNKTNRLTTHPSETNNTKQNPQNFYKSIRLAVYGISILFIILNINLSQIRGKKDAAVKHVFLILSDKPSTVIIRVYSDRLICKEFDYATKKFNNKIHIIKLSENSQLIMEPKDLGAIKSY